MDQSARSSARRRGPLYSWGRIAKTNASYTDKADQIPAVAGGQYGDLAQSRRKAGVWCRSAVTECASGESLTPHFRLTESRGCHYPILPAPAARPETIQSTACQDLVFARGIFWRRNGINPGQIQCHPPIKSSKSSATHLLFLNRAALTIYR